MKDPKIKILLACVIFILAYPLYFSFQYISAVHSQKNEPQIKQKYLDSVRLRDVEGGSFATAAMVNKLKQLKKENNVPREKWNSIILAEYDRAAKEWAKNHPAHQ